MLTELEQKLLESDAHRASRMSACNYVIRKEKIEEFSTKKILTKNSSLKILLFNYPFSILHY